MNFFEQIERLKRNIQLLWENPKKYGCDTPEKLMNASNSLTREKIALEKKANAK